MTTNLSEVVNKIFKGALSKPITTLVNVMLDRLVQYFVRRGVQAREEYNASRNYLKRLLDSPEKNHAKASAYHVKRYDIRRTKFDVEEPLNHATQWGEKT